MTTLKQPTAEAPIRALLGTKLGMTQVFDENNRVVPVTVVKAGPCVVTGIRTEETDGYRLATSEEIRALADEGIFLHYDSIKQVFS